MLFCDTETCGFVGPIVLLQLAEDDGDVEIYHIWSMTRNEVMRLIERVVEDTSVWFNVAFDWFHLSQMYTTLTLLSDTDQPLEERIQDYAHAESEAFNVDICLKPKGIIDVMLIALKTQHQVLMGRKPIIIKRVPRMFAAEVVEELNQRLVFKNIYFAKKGNPNERWTIVDAKDINGEISEDFVSLKLQFAPSNTLKALAAEVFGSKTIKYEEISVPNRYQPAESEFAPFAMAPYRDGKKKWITPDGTKWGWHDKWPNMIRFHIQHWKRQLPLQYASDDITHLRNLYHHFGAPPENDRDSVLAAMVGSVRWRGYEIDLELLEKQRKEAVAEARVLRAIANFNSPQVCRIYLEQVMEPVEQAALLINDNITTATPVLVDLISWRQAEVCDDCFGAGCEKCKDGFVETDEPHPVVERASNILKYRQLMKEIQLYEKLKYAKRFFASFNVIGTKSARMSGASGLNAQGINHSERVRQLFRIANPGMTNNIGDFKQFEVAIADAVYHDEWLHEQLLSGKKLHGLMGVFFFPGHTYEEILETDGADNPEDDLYKRSKQGVFALLFGGDESTLKRRVAISEEQGREAYHNWLRQCKGWAKARDRIYDMFCTMRQPNGIGTKVEWHEPHEYIESIFGFRRYFTLENRICRELYKLAEDPPKEWQQAKRQVVRREREQSVCGAIRSALFAAAFGVQSAIMRAAANHEIQSPGGEITKEAQLRIWSLQPTGFARWHVQPMNVHDEIDSPCIPELIDKQEEIINEFVEEYKDRVPLLAIDWKKGVKTWAEK